MVQPSRANSWACLACTTRQPDAILDRLQRPNGKAVIGVVVRTEGTLSRIILCYSPLWSPDGKQLLFRHDSERTPSVTSICIANPDGTQPRIVLDGESETPV